MALFIYAAALVLGAIRILFSAISFVVPSQIATAITYFTGYLHYFDSIWPVSDTMQALGTLFTFWGLWYSAKLLLKVYHMLPFIGKKVKLHGGA